MEKSLVSNKFCFCVLTEQISRIGLPSVVLCSCSIFPLIFPRFLHFHRKANHSCTTNRLLPSNKNHPPSRPEPNILIPVRHSPAVDPIPHNQGVDDGNLDVIPRGPEKTVGDKREVEFDRGEWGLIYSASSPTSAPLIALPCRFLDVCWPIRGITLQSSRIQVASLRSVHLRLVL